MLHATVLFLAYVVTIICTAIECSCFSKSYTSLCTKSEIHTDLFRSGLYRYYRPALHSELSVYYQCIILHAESLPLREGYKIVSRKWKMLFWRYGTALALVMMSQIMDLCASGEDCWCGYQRDIACQTSDYVGIQS